MVDNGSSMAPHWTQASKLIHILAWRALGYDENGMGEWPHKYGVIETSIDMLYIELYFTNPDTKVSVKQNPEQDLKEFDEAMSNGEPQDDTPRHESGIISALMRILASYSDALHKKPVTILILTDGIWAGIPDKNVDTFIKSHIEVLRLGNAGHSRPVTFQFIRFGDDPAGMERLRRLDDDMKEHGLPSVSPPIQYPRPLTMAF